MKEDVKAFITSLQDHISNTIEGVDGKARFREERWSHKGGGGGITRVIENGAVFEKGGVNFSAVEGLLPEKMASRMHTASTPFFATGVSVVLHPYSPMIPTVHCNYRYFEQYNERGEVQKAWFGGGADLTPYYPFLEDVKHFHRVHKDALDPFGREFYPKFKSQCDEYFFLPHRKETRGVGGIFFDYLKENLSETFALVRSCGMAFTQAYVPIVQRRKAEPYGEKEKQFQWLRRGRYVEFNLVYDRGTLFGLETEGRTESILMSLPPIAAWAYNYHPADGTEESRLAWFLKPHPWLEINALPIET